MTQRHRLDARTRVPRWLLVAVTLAGLGVVQVGHSSAGTPSPPVVAEITAAGLSEAGPGATDTATDECRLLSAPRTAATTAGFAPHPPVSASTTPDETGRSRAVTLSHIGVSRT